MGTKVVRARFYSNQWDVTNLMKFRSNSGNVFGMGGFRLGLFNSKTKNDCWHLVELKICPIRKTKKKRP